MANRESLLEYTIPQLLRWRVDETGERVALREKEFGIWRSLTWNQYYAKVRQAALGLAAIGLERGQTIALITDNIPEMLIVAIGGLVFGVSWGNWLARRCGLGMPTRSSISIARLRATCLLTEWCAR